MSSDPVKRSGNNEAFLCSSLPFLDFLASFLVARISFLFCARFSLFFFQGFLGFGRDRRSSCLSRISQGKEGQGKALPVG